MVLSARTLTVLVLSSLGLSVVLLVVVAAALPRRRGPDRARGPIQMDDVLRGILEGHAKALHRLEQTVRQLGTEDLRIGQTVQGAVQRVGLVRYDAFDDMGGRLSFSCALLDAKGDGVVITSINGRQDTRVYAKPVREGGSTHNLSEEEEEAIRQALTAPRETAEAVEAR